MLPLISVIVPSYKNFEYIYETLRSIFIQNYSNIELIISDDGSDNFNYFEIKEYILKNAGPNITEFSIIHHEINMGTVKNLNYAFKQSKGKYIIPLSSDDVFYDENSVVNIVNLFESSKSLVMTAFRQLNNYNLTEVSGVLPSPKNVKDLGNEKNLFRILSIRNFISGSCLYYNRNFFDLYGFLDESYVLLEDYPKVLQIAREKCKIEFLDKITIKYRQVGITSSKALTNKVRSQFNLDLNNTIVSEILPYKSQLGLFCFRFNKHKLGLHNSKNYLNKIMIHLLYPDVTIYLLPKYLRRIPRIIARLK